MRKSYYTFMETAPARKLLSIVVPLYNEERAVPVFFESATAVLDKLAGLSCEFVCVNDGSGDATLEKLLAAREKYGERVKIVDLSRNFGKEAALTAGLDLAGGDAVIPMDCDLQDPVELIPELVRKWEEGYEVVLAKRTDRSSDSYLKSHTAGLFYRLFNLVSDTPIPENVGDFRLLSRNAVDALKRLPERRRFMKGLFAWIGFRQATVEYSRKTRVSGGTKFTYSMLFDFALEGLASFSPAPLRWVLYMGLMTGTVAFLYAAYIVLRTLVYGVDVPGYASLITIMLFLGGVQLVGLGIAGEYIGRVYMEAKERPIYVVRKTYK